MEGPRTGNPNESPRTLPRYRKNISGLVFGDKRILGIDKDMKSTGTEHYWKCQCIYCCTTTYVSRHDLTHGTRIRCDHASILKPELVTPAMYKTIRSRLPLYKVWYAMNHRCYMPDGALYKYYGARGITVCDEWCMYPEGPGPKSDVKFRNFFRWALANGYFCEQMSDGKNCCSIKLLPNATIYSPETCHIVFRPGYKKRITAIK